MFRIILTVLFIQDSSVGINKIKILSSDLGTWVFSCRPLTIIIFFHLSIYFYLYNRSHSFDCRDCFARSGQIPCVADKTFEVYVDRHAEVCHIKYCNAPSPVVCVKKGRMKSQGKKLSIRAIKV